MIKMPRVNGLQVRSKTIRILISDPIPKHKHQETKIHQFNKAKSFPMNHNFPWSTAEMQLTKFQKRDILWRNSHQQAKSRMKFETST